ncbi:MAG: hypothetical protein AAGA67_05190 [Cyanobacteria bacterium P01_F01_bin.153]
MSRKFGERRLDGARVLPQPFLDEFETRDASTRRFVLNALTLFATISPEQQHQALNDLIQQEIAILSERSRKFLHRRVKNILEPFHIEKAIEDADVREYYYRYYMLTGIIPERPTPDYLNMLLTFIVGVELIQMIFRMSFMEQQRFFELQGKYSTQAMLFYRYIKPTRAKLADEKRLNRDPAGNHYYRRPKLTTAEALDFIFETFDLEAITYLGNFSEKLVFEFNYIYAKPKTTSPVM